MMHVLSVSADYTDRTSGKRTILCDIVCDTTADLPSNTATLQYLMGSTATIITNGKQYIIDSAGAWHIQPDGITLDLTGYYTADDIDTMLTGYYTAAETDTILTAYYTAAQTDTMLSQYTKLPDIFGGVGAEIIPSGADLNTAHYADVGCYICENGTIAASLANCPVNYAGFVMIVYSSGNRYRVILPTSGGVSQLFIETVTGGGTSFNAWYKIVGQAV